MRKYIRSQSGLKKRYLVVALLTIALAIPAVALAWSQTYANSEWFPAGGGKVSAFNSSIKENIMSYVFANGNYGETSLCNSGGSCYTWDSSGSGYIDDTRTISYGQAACQASPANTGNLYVYTCNTHN